VKSIIDLLDTIMRTPGVDHATKTRAGFLRSRLGGDTAEALLKRVFGAF
jgi:hypothetical protein